MTVGGQLFSQLVKDPAGQSLRSLMTSQAHSFAYPSCQGGIQGPHCTCGTHHHIPLVPAVLPPTVRFEEPVISGFFINTCLLGHQGNTRTPCWKPQRRDRFSLTTTVLQARPLLFKKKKNMVRSDSGFQGGFGIPEQSQVTVTHSEPKVGAKRWGFY